MTVTARPFLPSEALHDGALVNRIAQCARDWAHRWFFNDENCFVRASEVSRYFALGDEARHWRAANGELVLAIPASDQIKIATAALNLQHFRYKPAKADMDFIASLATAAIVDFLNDACELFTSERSAARAAPGLAVSLPRDCLHYAVSAGSAIFHFYVGRDLASSARKALCARTLTPTPLSPRMEALSDHMVFLGARVGKGKLGFTDISSLAIGDVFVTDHSVDEPLEITVNGELKSGAGLNLVQDGSKLELRLTQSGVI